LPELKGKYHDLITIEHLLTYTAIWDIPDGLSHYAKNGSQAVYQTIFESPLIARPGEKYYYTNTPAIVLGMIIEKIYTNTLDSIAQEKLFNPLNMHHATFDATHYPDDTVPPTEKDKHGDVHNIVHDETARALRQSNITSGHAGLFSPVGDILKYCSMILSNGKTDEGKQILSAETIEKFENNYVGSIGESASLGWELNQPRFMGNHSNPKMFGKTGFTGCVVIIDRPKKAAMVILSNAQYPTRHPNRDSINKLRRTIANIIFE
jgi:CubicO group peptidase (beta-lactamase class C family)